MTPSARPCQLRSIICEARPLRGGLARPLPKERPAHASQEKREVVARGQQGQRSGRQKEANAGQGYFPKHLDQPADQSALHDDAENADVGEKIPVGLRVVTESLFGEERKERGHDRQIP